jgi:dihydroneopterin aldolase
VGLVYVRDLRVSTVIGVGEHERRAPRELLVSLSMEADLDRVAASDDLADAIDYAGVAALVRDHAGKARFRLLEALAGSLATVVLRNFPRIDAGTVRVEKPAALPEARATGVEIRRQR